MSYNERKKAGDSMVIGIIGGGASGMVAAIAASENPHCRVLLFERQARVGRKLLATGNGRCNLTNIAAGNEHYHGDQPEFAKAAMEMLTPEKTIAWFRDLGLYTVVEATGRVYPYSDQANSVVDVLRFALNRPNIQVVTGFEVSKVRREDQSFVVENGEGCYRCDRLIIACGGLAGTKLGGSMSGYKLLKSMGHHITRLRPSLVQVKSSWNGCVSLKGVRTNCHAAIYCGDKLHRESTGELQFTDYGLSGPVIFEISRDVCLTPGNWICKLDFLPEVSADSLEQELKHRKYGQLMAEDLLTGILHNRLGRVLTAAAGIHGQQRISQLSDDHIAQVCQLVKAMEVSITEPLGMDSAQVTAGGVLTNEFNSGTMESCLVPGLYACGEVLDIDGGCGGYNLQWAWSSGMTAGLHAGGVTL